jgi:hypothetical protein
MTSKKDEPTQQLTTVNFRFDENVEPALRQKFMQAFEDECRKLKPEASIVWVTNPENATEEE